MLLRILHVLAVLSLSSAALMAVLVMAARGVGFRSPFFAFISASAFLGFVILTSRVVRWRVPKGLYSVRPWERTGKISRIMGVSLFGALVRRRPLRYLNGTVYLGRRPGDLAAVQAGMVFAETSHFWALALSAPLLVYTAIQGWWDAFAWLVGINCLVHLYPVLNLRRVRGRVEPLIIRCVRDKSQPATAAAPGS